MTTTAPVLLIDDGELDDVRDILVELGTEFAHLRGGAVPDRITAPQQLFVATSRRAILAESWPAPGPLKIGVVTEDSNTLRSMLRRLGFDLLIRRPVHPYAMRLVLVHALYSGDEKRRDRRVALGCEISTRQGLRRKAAVLADLSVRGARLLSADPIPAGGRLRLHLPKELTGDKPLTVRAKVQRCSETAKVDGRYEVGLAFEKLPPPARLCIVQILKTHLSSPVTLPEAKPRRTPTSPEREAEDRRKHARGAFEQEIVTLDQEAATMVIGRNLSVGGMRIDPNPNVQLNDTLRLAIYGAPREDPFVVRARVVRDDQGGGLGLQFENLKPGLATRLESLVAKLPAVESLQGEESNALGSVVSSILEREAPE